MAEFKSSTLWRVSQLDLLKQKLLSEADGSPGVPSLLSSTMRAELHALEQQHRSSDAIEVFAACLRLRVPALVLLQVDEIVWPITVFPNEGLYHSRHSLLRAFEGGIVTLKAIGVEPPGVRPPGHWMHERAAPRDFYHPLVPALWQLALDGPRSQLIGEIAGTAAYRALRNPATDNLPTPGALGPATQRLHQETAALRHIAQWPGMSVDRAVRLLNALYLSSNLMITRGHPAARAEPGKGLLSRRGL